MKKNALRIALLVVVLGGLAAIPASTGGWLAAATSSEDGVDLGMVLLVNRLELSRQQMETLRTAILGVVEKNRALDERQAAFKQEMIAFGGTAEELDARLASFREETKAAQAEAAAEQDAAIATLKNTLTMEQGEILARAFPEIVVSFGGGPATREWGRKMGVGRATERGCVAALVGPLGVVVVRGTEGAEAETERVTRFAEKLRTTVERVRERVAERFGGADTELPKLLQSMPNEAATQTEGTNVGRFMAPEAPVTPGLARLGGNACVTGWLERFARVLELKLAATT